MIETSYFKHYQIIQQATDWQQAITLAAQPLLNHQCISENYIKSMIQNVIDNGPYIVIMPYVALPHTRSEEGALKTSVSIVKLIEPVLFPENKDVKLVIAFAAYDNDTHMALLSSLVDVLMDDQVMEKVLACEDVDALKELLQL